ncbi:MAG: thioredoxin [Rikenellaceae bacterium]|jgi:thioredoxin|nr:thioredoxin [Rikenellaceae bacterium]
MKRLIIALALVAVSCGGTRKPSAVPTAGVAKPKQLTQTEFAVTVFDYKKAPAERKLLSDKPVLVDFYADWCGPCKMIAPVIEELAAEYDGRVDFYKVDVDNARALAMSLNISSIPLVMVLPVKGEPVGIVGAASKEEYRQAIERALNE